MCLVISFVIIFLVMGVLTRIILNPEGVFPSSIFFLLGGIVTLLFTSGLSRFWHDNMTRAQHDLQKSLDIDELLAKILLSNFGGFKFKAWTLIIFSLALITISFLGIFGVIK